MDTGLPDGDSSFRSTLTISQQREEMRAQLKAGLSSLPSPKNDYEIVIPEVRGLVTFCNHLSYTDLCNYSNCQGKKILMQMKELFLMLQK